MIYPYLANRLYHIKPLISRRYYMKIHFFKNGSISITLKIKDNTNNYQKNSYFFKSELEYKKFIESYQINI